MLKYCPREIVRLIKSYIYVNCGECKLECIYSEGLTDITTIYYRAIFNDDFPFPRIYKSYKFICNKCLDNLKKEYIKPL